MLSSQEEQAERRRVFAQDQSLRGTTFHQHAQADADTPRGRFTAHERSTVVGAQPTFNYPAAAAHQADPCGIEPPLGYRIDAMPEQEPLEVSFPSPQATDPADAPSTPLGQRAGSLSHSGDHGVVSQPSSHV